MLKGIDIKQRVEFISSKDETEPKTIFILRPLTCFEMLEFTSGTSKEVIDMIEKSIVEIKNFKEGEPVNEILKSLDIATLGELIKAVNELNHLTGEDIKN